MQQLRAENSSLKRKLAEVTCSKADVVRLEKLLQNEYKKQRDNTELKEAIEEWEDLRRTLPFVRGTLTTTNLRLFKYTCMKSKLETTVIKITELAEDWRVIQQARPQIELSEKDRYISDLEQMLLIKKNIYKCLHMESLGGLPGLMKNVGIKLRLVTNVEECFKMLNIQLQETSNMNDSLEIEVRTLHIDLTALHMIFEQRNAEHEQQLEDLAQLLEQQTKENRLTIHNLFFEDPVQTFQAEYCSTMMQLMKKNSCLENDLYEKLNNSKRNVANDGHDDNDNAAVGRPEENGDNDVVGRQAANESLELQNTTRQESLQNQEMRSESKKREVLLLEKINTLPLGATTDVGANLIDDLKNLLKLSAAVTGCSNSDASLNVIQGSKSCAPNLNRLEATVEKLYDDIERLLDGLKEQQMPQQSEQSSAP